MRGREGRGAQLLACLALLSYLPCALRPAADTRVTVGPVSALEICCVKYFVYCSDCNHYRLEQLAIASRAS